MFAHDKHSQARAVVLRRKPIGPSARRETQPRKNDHKTQHRSDSHHRSFPEHFGLRQTLPSGRVSNGAFLAYRLACQQARRFLGVASVGGTEVLRRCHPERPVSVLHIHGPDDLRVQFDGAILRRPRTPGALELVRRWRVRNHCPSARTRRQRSLKLLISRTSGCRHGTQVQLVALESFAHAWPGASAPYGQPSTYDATSEIGGFFASPGSRPR
jgi:polyhydroxybutyrate depolymerase